MSYRLDVDGALRTWFEEGPNELPEVVLDAVATQIDDIEQRRPTRMAWVGIGGRRMNRVVMAGVGVTLALIAISGGYAALNLGGDGGLMGDPTVTADPTPAPSPPGGPVEFTSERHGYTLLLPDERWDVVEHAGEWRAGGTFNQDDAGVDAIVRTPPTGLEVLINSQPLPEDMSFEEWLSEYREAAERAYAPCQIIASEAAEMAGERAALDRWTCNTVSSAEILAVHDGRVYAMRVYGSAGPRFEPRDVIEEWLDRFDFAP